MTSVLVNAVKELKAADDKARKQEQDDITDLKQLIAAQQKEIDALKRQISAPAH
jgi:cell division protein FtsL